MPHLIAPQFTSPIQGGGGYQVDYSCRFNDDDSAYLERAWTTDGNKQKFTYSTWTKRGTLGLRHGLFRATASSAADALRFDPADTIGFYGQGGVPTNPALTTDAVFRDPSGWYHVVVQVDTNQATASDRVKIWVNGVQQTLTGTYPSSGYSFTGFNNATRNHQIGLNTDGATVYFDGYMAQCVLINDVYLDATSFGEFDANGVWRPKNVAGLTFGTTGFLLDFAIDSDLGNDVSGNGNDFTSSGLTTADRMTDTPTNNWCTMSPIDADVSHLTFSDGNLTLTGTSQAEDNPARATAHVESGKWFYTVEYDQIDGGAAGGFMPGAGIMSSTETIRNGVNSTDSVSLRTNGDWYLGTNSQGSTGLTITAGTEVAVAFDVAATKIWWGTISSGVITWDGNPAGGTGGHDYSSRFSGSVAPLMTHNTGTGGVDRLIFAFGQNGFHQSVSPPSGFKALNTSNLPAPTIKDGTAHFQPTLYTGNATARSIDQSGNSTFQPDFVWIKNRDQTDNHKLIDAVRGATKELSSNTTIMEATDANGLTAFNGLPTPGFSLGTGANGYNDNGEDFVAWQWKANGDSSPSANTTAGFSIVTYTGDGNPGRTVAHGLVVSPRLILLKKRNADGPNWRVFHASMGAGNTAYLNLPDASNADPDRISAVSSTTFTLNTGASPVNGSSDTYVAYCFAEVPGYSRIGSYIGGGASVLPFVWCGFRPAFALFKNASVGSTNWRTYDATRSSYNQANNLLYPNLPDAEVTSEGGVDLLSNGFKIRIAGSTELNGSGNTIVFIAFAEYPFGGADTTPAPAR